MASMDYRAPCYQRHRFPSEIISKADWHYHRFCLSFLEVEELLAERGITTTYEAIRQWCRKFGPDYARKLKKCQGPLGDTWHIDEIFITIQGKRQYRYRAVDQDGNVLGILIQRRPNQRAAERFFRRLLEGQGGSLGVLLPTNVAAIAPLIARSCHWCHICFTGMSKTVPKSHMNRPASENGTCAVLHQ